MNDVIEETRKDNINNETKNEKERNIGHYNMLEWIRMFETCIELI